jgi:hypothetical protein
MPDHKELPDEEIEKIKEGHYVTENRDTSREVNREEDDVEIITDAIDRSTT